MLFPILAIFAKRSPQGNKFSKCTEMLQDFKIYVFIILVYNFYPACIWYAVKIARKSRKSVLSAENRYEIKFYTRRIIREKMLWKRKRLVSIRSFRIFFWNLVLANGALDSLSNSVQDLTITKNRAKGSKNMDAALRALQGKYQVFWKNFRNK